MIDTIAQLTAMLEEHYAAHKVRLHALHQADDKAVYRVEHGNGVLWALRWYPAERAALAHAQALVLQFLEAHAYPAERLISTRADAPICVSAESVLIATTFVSGHTLAYDPSALYRLGMSLGRLHALATSSARRMEAVFPAAAMLVAPELAYARGELTAVADQLQTAQQAGYTMLLQAIDRLDRCETLPAVLIHNDCHPGNAIDAGTDVTLIDWEGAGAGPAILDVGFLLASSDTASPWTPRLQPDPARVAAVVDGYCRHHQLSDPELACLADAIRFRALVYGACSFAEAVRRGAGVSFEDWWWRRYQAADALAERAGRHFRQHC
jgi:Ser/Thr protein kinase RdoA (MazF antagonist)